MSASPLIAERIATQGRRTNKYPHHHTDTILAFLWFGVFMSLVSIFSIKALHPVNGFNQSSHFQLQFNDTRNVKKPIATAVLVEMRCHPMFSVALLGAARNLGPEILIVVMHSSENKHFVRGVIESSPVLIGLLKNNRLTLQQIREVDWGEKCPEPKKPNCGVYSGKYWYSAMFVNVTFWNQFKTPYVLTMQADTLLCRSFPTRDLVAQNVSFTGGVSGFKAGFKSYSLRPNPKVDNLLDGGQHLNGGFSFRNVQWVKNCIESHAHRSVTGWIEDELYRQCREHSINGTFHESEEGAYSFASDNGQTLCFTSPLRGGQVCPVGVHKPWTKGRKKREKYLELIQNCSGLVALEALSKQKVQKGRMCKAFDLEGVSYSTFECNCTV